MTQPGDQGEESTPGHDQSPQENFPPGPGVEATRSRAHEGCQSPFAATRLQQSNFSHQGWAQRQSNNLTAICSHCRARNAGELAPPAIHHRAELYRCDSDQSSPDHVASQNPAVNIRCHPGYLLFSGKCRDTLSVWDPITGSNLTVLEADNKDPWYLNFFFLKTCKDRNGNTLSQ